MAVVNSYVDTRVQNVVCQLDRARCWDLSARPHQLSYLYRARKNVLTQYLNDFAAGDTLVKFQRRITAMCWHPTVSYLVSAACKGGSIAIASGQTSKDGEIEFRSSLISKGSGPGGAVFSLKFHENDRNILYTAALTGMIDRLDLEHDGKRTLRYHDTGDFYDWYTAMDVNVSANQLAAGDNKGNVRLFDLRNGYAIADLRVHKAKIHHCEFNKQDPNLLVTAALDHPSIRLWDIRSLRMSDPEEKVTPLQYFETTKGVNVATFNRDGSRLAMNDQGDQITVYEGPLWAEVVSFEHPHRQFQHLTGIELSWHPLADLLVVGRYPIAGSSEVKETPLRPIEFFDAQTGDLVHSLYHPKNLVVSLNSINPRGDVLASGMGANLLLWQATRRLEKLSENPLKKPSKIPQRMPKNLRGGGASDEDSDDEISKIKKKLASRKKGTTTASKAKGKSKAMEESPSTSKSAKSKPAASTSKSRISAAESSKAKPAESTSKSRISAAESSKAKPAASTSKSRISAAESSKAKPAASTSKSRISPAESSEAKSAASTSKSRSLPAERSKAKPASSASTKKTAGKAQAALVEAETSSKKKSTVNRATARAKRKLETEDDEWVGKKTKKDGAEKAMTARKGRSRK